MVPEADFFTITTTEKRGGVIEIAPDFIVGRSKDIMIRGSSFYGIWDEDTQLWSTDEYDVQRLVDGAVLAYAEKLKAEGVTCTVKLLKAYGTNGWNQFRKFQKNVSDNSHQLDTKLTFGNTVTKKSDYVSRRLPYDLTPGDHKAWTELTTVLYAPEELAKIEWAIGAIVSGDSKKIEKFLVFYGPGGTGKSTIMKIIQKLFVGYITTFEAKALVGNSNTFSTEVFANNPLVAIQHDGDLSKIEDNSKLNSIVGHDEMWINQKYKTGYNSQINAFLFMGTNKPVKISDAKSGLIRRLLDVKPTGDRVDPEYYNVLMSSIDFELGAIAQHCYDVYKSMGKNYYNQYKPLDMMLKTDVFFNYVEAHFDIFKQQDGATLKQAYALYKEYASDTGLEFVLPQYKFREEMRNYFDEFSDRKQVGDLHFRSYYSGFNAQPYKTPAKEDPQQFSLVLEEVDSLLDLDFADQPAQYGNSSENPIKYWTDEERLIDGVLKKPRSDQVVDTTLEELDTTKLHFVKVPENHIVIDFDLKGEDGDKSLERNLQAASEWPATYAELSKSGSGVHLHYHYSGDTDQLGSHYGESIEIKVFNGNSSLRRLRSRCNAVPVATISSGLPFKEKKVLAASTMKSEKTLRTMIGRNLNKEIHPGTKSSVDFIKKLLDEANEEGLVYDVTDMRSKIAVFANNSSNQSLAALKTFQQMKFKSDTEAPAVVEPDETPIVFFDVEVFPNLLVICWKYQGSDTIVRMINPSPSEVEGLFQFKLIGFNNRRYDNHILWARMMGYTLEQIYALSKRIIDGVKDSLFGEAYNLSYTDIFDFSSKKQSLKKFEIELGIHHMELNLPWEEPAPESEWAKIVEYCCNDVKATEVVFEARSQDFVARQILSELTGLTVNHTTQAHTAKLVFGNERNPQKDFVYTDLANEFPGYQFDPYAKVDKSTYRDEGVGEGGYVYAEPGMYKDVALLDVASMHPTSIELLNVFGDYTANFAALTAARLAIKNNRFDEARQMFGGKLAPYLVDETQAKKLSDALKIVINIVYGLTSAKFPNSFKDPRNADNIVAKRGALFMIDLKHAVQGMGYTVAHIKTDSIKIPNADAVIIDFVTEFGKRYGYTFEHEGTYEQFCLVNDAVYIAKSGGKWNAVGAQFQHPYVFKSLFSNEPIEFKDLCETKSVTKGSMYLAMNEIEPTPSDRFAGTYFVGRVGSFVPVTKESGGGHLFRVSEDKWYAITGTKDHLWAEAEIVATKHGSVIDMSYFENMARTARETIQKFGNFEEFVS